MWAHSTVRKYSFITKNNVRSQAPSCRDLRNKKFLTIPLLRRYHRQPFFIRQKITIKIISTETPINPIVPRSSSRRWTSLSRHSGKKPSVEKHLKQKPPLWIVSRGGFCFSYV